MRRAEPWVPARPVARAARARRRRYRRRRLGVGAAAVVVLALAVWTVTRVGSGGRSTAAPAASHRTTTTVAPTTTTTVPPTTTSTTGPGSLPQTGAFPTTTSPVFTSNIAALWSAVSTGQVQQALPAFFPEGAYVQLKDIANAEGDYSDRLVVEYEADVTAAHQLLGADPAAATFVGVDADSAYGHWVPPGVCDNDVGYFELPDTRIVYSLDGQVHSFGIASMISWRGEWYVVHLGAILRSGAGGEVDSPQAGPGAPVYSSTC
jgi:hypothetical protein